MSVAILYWSLSIGCYGLLHSGMHFFPVIGFVDVPVCDVHTIIGKFGMPKFLDSSWVEGSWARYGRGGESRDGRAAID